MLTVPPEFKDIVNRAILVTGAARSGTTMMGNLIHSCDGVELCFEPPALFPLIGMIDDVNERLFRLLFETYLVRDFGLDAVAGRRQNLRQGDWTFSGKIKGTGAMAKQLTLPGDADECYQMLLDGEARLAFKMPDIIPWVTRLHRYYPGMEILVMTREPEALVQSLERREWFGPGAGPMSMWLHDTGVPYWATKSLRNKDVGHYEWPSIRDRLVMEDWGALSEAERCRYYVDVQNAAFPRDAWAVSYERFCQGPRQEFAKIANRLRLVFGPCTASLLEEVR